MTQKRRELEFPIASESDIERALGWADRMARIGLKAGPVVLRLGRERRTLDQNAHVHPLARAIQRHMEKHGAPKRSETWWRYYLLGKFSGQEVTPDPDPNGGESFVVINKIAGTSALQKDTAANFIDWMYSFGVDVGVDWSDRDRKIVKEHGKGDA